MVNGKKERKMALVSFSAKMGEEYMVSGLTISYNIFDIDHRIFHDFIVELLDHRYDYQSIRFDTNSSEVQF